MPPSATSAMNGGKYPQDNGKKDLPQKPTEPRDTGAEPRSAQRVLFMLTAMPLGLAVFAFLVSGPPFEDTEAMPGWADRQGKSQVNESMDLMHCPNRPRNPNFMFPYRPWHASPKPLDAPRICICTTTSAGPEQTLPWLYYHRTIGVEMFIVFVEGKAALPENAAALESIPGVQVVPRTAELDYRQAHSRVWNETWLSFFFYKPCNYELFVRQSLNMEVAIDMARAAKVDWISHVDTDELLYPAGASEFSLQRLLSEAPPDADNVIFPNYETAIERDDIKDPFSEISMYKKNFDHVSKEAYFGHYKEATKGNPNYYLTYGNGKSAARMVDHLRSNGAHRFHNYARQPKEFKFPEAAVLHYTYTKFSDLTSRRDRCGCKPTKEDVKRCFMLDFDRQAFIVASTQTEEQMLEWYREHVVWTDPALNDKLLKKGLFGRIHTPQVIVRGIQSSGIVNATIRNGLELLRKRSVEAKGATRGTARGASGKAAQGRTSGLTGAGAGTGGSALTRGLIILAKQQRTSAEGVKRDGPPGAKAGAGVRGASGSLGTAAGTGAGGGTGSLQGALGVGARRSGIAQATSKERSLVGKTAARTGGAGAAKQARVGADGVCGGVATATGAAVTGTGRAGAAEGTTTASSGAAAQSTTAGKTKAGAGTAGGTATDGGAGAQGGGLASGGRVSDPGTGTEDSDDAVMEDVGGGVVTDQVATQRRRLLALDDEAYRRHSFLEDGMAMPPMPWP